MIIKKPYAFLIKHFRLIHGILFIMILYLLINSINIYGFFSGYANNGYFISQANLASHYINILMYLGCILVLIVSSIVYFLLELKNKGNKMYMFIALYYLILMLFYIYMNSVFRGLETELLKIESIRAFRDISLIALVPQIIFIFVVFARTLGFNIKKFDFKRDLEELEIDKSDSEEIEVTLVDNSFKIKRSFRKILRLTKYFFLEHKLFVIGVASILVFMMAFAVFRRIQVYTDAYNEKQQLQANSLWFNVNESYITGYDMRNSTILNGKKYVLVNVSISNKYNNEYELDENIFKLKVNDSLLFPNVTLSDKFLDLGTTYYTNIIKAGEDKDFIVVFEIDEKYIKEDYIFKIKDFVSSGNEGIKYKDIIIKPINIEHDKDMGSFILPNEIKLNDSLLKESKFLISSYEIASRFKEEYTYKTNDGKIHSAVYSILPANINKGDADIIRLKAKFSIDESINANKYIKDTTDFLYYYGIIRYRYMGNYKEVRLTKMNIDFQSKDYIYMEIPKEVELANKIELIILIRGVKYTILLK